MESALVAARSFLPHHHRYDMDFATHVLYIITSSLFAERKHRVFRIQCDNLNTHVNNGMLLTTLPLTTLITSFGNQFTASLLSDFESLTLLLIWCLVLVHVISGFSN